MPSKPTNTELRRDAEARLQTRQKNQATKPTDSKTAVDAQRLLHELQVHQVELEMQNAELQDARNGMESLLGKYTDLYDFAPVGYFTLTTEGRIQLVNLTGASLVGIERSKLIGQSFAMLVSAELRPAFHLFLDQVFASQTKQEGDFHLLSKGQSPRVVKIRSLRSSDGQECSAVVVDITERSEAEDKVRVSEIRYRRLFEAAHDGVLLLDPNTRKITDANPFMTKLLGYQHDQLVGKELFEIGLLKDEAASQEMFRKLKKEHQVRYEDLPLESQDGRHQEVEVVANLYQENGHAVIQCNIRDITARKHAEQALRLTNTAMESVASSIFITTGDGTIQYVNPAFTNLSGYVATEVIGKKPSLVRSGEHDEAFYQNLWQTVSAGRVWSGQITNRHKDGKLYVCEQSISPVKNASGEISHFVSVQSDITERLRAELMVRRSEALFSALFAQAPVGVYVVDAQFRLRQVNPKAQPIFDNIHPHIGREFAELVHILWPTKIAHQVIKQFRHTLKTGEPYHVTELAGRRRDLRVKNIYEWSLQRITLPGGEHSVVCFFEDITERREAELALRRLAVQTALNHKMKRELVRRQVATAALETSQQTTYELLIKSRQLQEEQRDLSHRLLTAHEEERKRISRELHDVIAQALTGINLQLASLQAHPAASSSDLAERIAKTQQLVAQSVDTVHSFARDLRPSMLDDLGIIPALRTFSQDYMKRTGLIVEMSADAGVEKLGSAERTVLYRIAQEALTNVSRHAKATRAEIHIQESTGSICMAIKDNGRGFDASDTTKSSRLGVLGMRERVEMIGGIFSIESAPGQPTIIRVDLPTDRAKTLKPRS